MLRLRWTPLDGWRRFFGEVGIIVLGVLVAVGLGVIATEIGWRNDVARTREALSFEFGEAIGQGRDTVRVAPCVEQRLDELSQIIATAERDGRLPPLGSIGNPSWRTWDSGVWESAVAAQTASHFPREDAIGIASFYSFVTILRESTSRELDAWTRLFTLVGPGRPFAPDEAASLNAAIGEARMVHRLMSLAAIRAEQMASMNGLAHDDPTARKYTDQPIADRPICMPISPEVPTTYGQAPFRGIIERARANPLTKTPSVGR